MAHFTPPTFKAKLVAAAVAACFATAAQSNPVGPAVVNGTASFAQQGNTLTVTNSNGAIINWQGFSINANETTRFIQPSASSTVLNRVVTQDPSTLLGSLQSNGRVFLINTAGIMVGQGARIDVAGFVASTLNISDQDFLANRLNFTSTPNAGNLSNAGTITTPTGGSVYLVAPNVENSGVINTPGGETILAAGQTVQLIDTSTPGVKVEITGDRNQATNLGQIVAEAGRIGMAGVIVKNSGTLNASSVVSEGGRIFLRASQDSYVEGNGKIIATGTQGGRIEVLGNRVAVMDNAQLDASGTDGGGTVLVGGDYQGKNPDVQNAQAAYFGPQATIKADATDSGNGGKVILWADDTTRAYGSISAKGGNQGGDGGFVEVSGKRYLDFQGTVDTSATNGMTGTLLLDPTNVFIANNQTDATNAGMVGTDTAINITGPAIFSVGAATPADSLLTWGVLSAALGTNNVVVHTASAAASPGDITVASGSYMYNSPYTLSLYANRHITLNGGGFINSGGGSFDLVAGWNGNVATPNTAGAVGDVWLKNAYIQASGGGTLSIKAAGSVKLDATAAGGSAQITSSGASQWIEAVNGSVQLMGGIGGQGMIQYYGTGLQTVRGGSISVLANAASSTNNYQSEITSSGSQTVQATTGGITLTAGGLGGAGDGNAARISATGTQLIEAFSSISLTGGAGGNNNEASIMTQNGNQTINAATMSLSAGAVGNRNSAMVSHNGTGNQLINLTGSGNVLTLAGGGGAGSSENRATIGQWGTTGSQTINIGNIGAANVVLTGGAGTGMGATSTECGASCNGYLSSNDAAISNKGSGGQTLQFNVAGSALNLTGGTGGNENSAHIHNESTGTQQILGNPNITLTGGANGGALVRTALKDYELGNEASISSNTSNQIINAGTITLNGAGNASTIGGAFIGGPQSTITTTGNVVLNGGAGTGDPSDLGAKFVDLTAGSVKRYIFATPAAFGEMVSVNSTYNIGGNLTLSGGAVSASTDPTTGLPVGGSPAAIGSMSGTATITANVQNAIALGAASNSYIGSWDGLGGTISLTSGIAGTGSMSLDAGKVGTGSTGSVILDAQGTGGSISQPTGKIWAGSLTATAKTGISLLGSNQVGTVSAVTDTGNIGYNSTNSFHVTDMWAKDPAGGITLTTIAVPAAVIDLGLGTLTAGTNGTVSVTTTGSLFDDNGTGVTNIKGQSISLTSYGSTSSSTLAISTDVEMTGSAASLTANVGPTATYGDISVRSAGTQPSSITLNSQATSQGNISYYHSGALSLSASTAFTSSVGSVSIGASGPVTVGAVAASVAANPNVGVYIGSAGDLTVSSALNSAGALGLAAGGTLAVNSSVSSGAGGDLRLGGGTVNLAGNATSSGTLHIDGPAVNITGSGSASTDAFVKAGNLTINSGSLSATRDITATVDGDIRMNGVAANASMTAGNDVRLTLTNGTSTLYLNDNPANAYTARINSAAATKIHLDLLGRSTGGVFIDGVETLATAAGGSGFHNGALPAVEGAGLIVTYGLMDNTVANLLAASVTSTSSDPGTTADQSTLLPTSSTSSAILTTGDSSQAVGGTTGTFGAESSNGGETTTASGNGSANGDKKEADEKDKGKEDGKKKDDKSKDKKNGSCT